MDSKNQKCGSRDHPKLTSDDSCGGNMPAQHRRPTDLQSKSPFKNFRQAWRAVRQVREDYRTGRMTRKAQEQPATSPENCSTQPRNLACNEEVVSSDHSHIRRTGHQGWKAQRGEYPWRIEKTIQGDVNWRGTWILEVKDLFDVTWERRRIHDGRRWRWETIPQGHWPFSPYNDEAHEDGRTTNADTKPSKEEKH